MNDWLTAAFTLAGTLFAGVGLKLVERWITRASEKSRVDAELRGEYKGMVQDKKADIIELKLDLEKARQEIDKHEEEVIRWREKYYEEWEVKVELLNKLKALESRIKELELNEENRQGPGV